MAKRVIPNLSKPLKKTRPPTAVSLPKLALDPRTPFWKTTEFPQNTLKIYSWNLNGLRSVLSKKALQGFLTQHDPDILCLNETRITETVLAKEKIADSLFPEKYLHFWNCSVKPGYAGIAILSKIRPLNVQHGIGIEKHDQEGRVTCMEFGKFVLVACYAPNSGQKLARVDYRTEEWNKDFMNYLKLLRERTKKEVALCGDLNIAIGPLDTPTGKIKGTKATEEEKEGFAKLLESGFIDTFRHLYPKEAKYSYHNARFKAKEKNKGWRIDYGLVTKGLLNSVEESQIVSTVTGSDHYPIQGKTIYAILIERQCCIHYLVSKVQQFNLILEGFIYGQYKNYRTIKQKP
eukprot:TRINITY_DN1263_c0_g1_i2.p1 TRINITY_DN1263_c0_g1~~TRINITY_DN1263_c0_g1_i2.p1  ORF type:complete len:372 (-),score=19.15 TRINITY_DN1263_c0_g1_i2:105-1145(-)